MRDKPDYDISARARRMWERLQDWYGTRLAETYGPWPPKDWCAVVDKTDNDTVKRALSIIRAEHLQFPPTFPQFCKAMTPQMMPVHTGPTVQDQLARYVVRHYWQRMTIQQRVLGWQFLYRERNAFDAKGKEIRAPECVGVIVPQRDGIQAYRVSVDDMNAMAAA